MKEQSSRIVEKYVSSGAEYYLPLIENEQEKLKLFFAHYLPSDFHPQNIMDFCCGIANEEPVLYDIYGHDTSITSFDSSPEMIQKAKDLNLNRKSILQLNIKDINDYFQEETFDLLIGRNIPINPNRMSTFFDRANYPDIWPQFLTDLKKHLSPDSRLLMTFARDDEFFRAVELLDNLDYQLLVQEKNKIVVPSDHIGIAGADVKDNYVVIAAVK